LGSAADEVIKAAPPETIHSANRRKIA
jgi:hypothetical protein